MENKKTKRNTVKCISNIPKELAIKIMSVLDIKGACAMRATCVNWRACTAAWSTLDLTVGERVTLSQAAQVCNPTTLRTLKLPRTTQTKQLLYVPTFTRLQTLKLSGRMFTTEKGGVVLKAITTTLSASLRELDMRRIPISNRMVYIAKLTNLHTLNINGSALVWQDYAYLASMTTLTSLSARNCDITDAVLPLFGELVNLQSLDLSSNFLTDAGMQHLTLLTSLKHLNLSGTDVSDSGIVHLPQSLTSLLLRTTKVCTPALLPPGLETLDFNCNAMVSADLCTFSHTLKKLSMRFCSNPHSLINVMWCLEHLDMAHCDLSDVHLVALPTTITHIAMEFCTSITDAGIMHLTNLTRLQVLILKGCTLLTDQTMRTLSQIPTLRELNVNYCHQITDAGLEAIAAGLPRLRVLEAQACKALTDAGLAHIAKLTSLKHLNLSCTHLTSTGLMYLIALKSTLVSLQLNACPGLTHAAMVHIAALTNLKTLSLREFGSLSKAGVECIALLTELQDLQLADCDVTDKELFCISALPNLHTLNLSNSDQLTYEGVWCLLATPKLRNLDLTFCERISNDDQEYLMDMLI